MPTKLAFATRLWYYFRLGYSTYLTFILGALNTLVVVWYLAIQQMPSIQNLFGHFIPFAVITTIVGTPLAIGIGWIHVKRSPAWSSELDISVEANPYNYKLVPGYWRETIMPLYLELLVELSKLLDAQDMLTDEDRSRIKSLQRMMQVLIDGGFVGTPRRGKM